MSSSCLQRLTSSLLLLGLLLVCLEGGAALELTPSVSELVLNQNSSVTLVCSGWDRVTWRLPQDFLLEGVSVENQGTRSVLRLHGASWRNSGSYVCEEASSEQSRTVDIFIPGQGPDEWFVPMGPSVVMKEGEEGTIPCVVSDPKLNVTLYERPSRRPANGTSYKPSRGFTGPLKDTSYICLASGPEEERESHVFYVFSIVVPEVMEVEITASRVVLRQGEALTVNCTVQAAEMVYFNWDIPRKQEFEPLTEFLPSQIRSIITIPMATLADSGVYVCEVQDTVQGSTVQENVTITVLERGFVRVEAEGQTDVSCPLHHTVELSVDINAHPPPNITWSHDNSTVTMETSLVTTTHLTHSRYTSTLTLGRVQLKHRGSYAVTVWNEDDVQEMTFDLEVTVPPKITQLSDLSEGRVVLCVSEGAPPPSIHWYSCHSTHRCSNQTVAWQSLWPGVDGVTVQENISYVEDGGLAQVHSLLTLQSLGSISTIRCETRNPRGWRAWDIRLVSNSLFSQVAVLAAVLVLIVLAVIFLIILILICRKKPRYEFRWKVIESVSPDGQQYTYVDPTQLPYNSAWEVQRDNVVLGNTVGSGAFGRVVEATVYGLQPPHSSTKVAVKMLKSTASVSEGRSLMSELKVLSHLGPHINIVNLLGACTQGGPVLLITEFCCHGDLVGYLQHNKHTFLQSNTSPQDKSSDTDGGYMDMNKEECVQYVTMQELGDQIKYTEIEPAVYESLQIQPGLGQEESTLSLSESPLLSLQDLLCFSHQVAQGMAFLSSKNCVHRDLAARNVLVSDGKLVKICDFRLARDITKDQNYIAKGNSFLPVKWMAPESIFECVYTTQSDVWSYGVLLWEIFSLGESPYPDMPINREFYSALKRGYRMAQPRHATNAIYDMMKLCWNEKWQSRPPFSSLVDSTGDMLTDTSRKRYLQVTQRFLSGEHPAVFRSKTSTDRTTAQTGNQSTDPESYTSQALADQSKEESEEAGPSTAAYPIPISDVAIETSGQVLDTATQETERCLLRKTLEVKTESPAPQDAPAAEQGAEQRRTLEEEEESFL
ncbi:platelet-derived growth factor receptor beta-like isoform X3 [Lampris incognitus]|uniref:platelet-derived growth factor receptor beta-like isoform X3 n=1 Tax=Lampris incognitus TaxID=2546036 RepID=UPI0024B574D7|nr:platelet-derived growth factor receptor beta-like isoform X3 [Lampris incognitus]